jgi:hypothetical protein
MSDPRRLTPDEERKRGDPRFDLDLDFLPHTFATPQDTLDAYNEIGYRVKIQFRLYEQKRKMGRIVMFSLCCAMRNNPKFLPRYAGGTYTKLSQCNVNVRFIYNQAKDNYQRVEGSWKSVHDHKLELDDKCNLPTETMSDIKKWWMEDPNVKCSTIIKRVKESSHQVNEKGQSIFLHLKHLDVLNALRLIRGTGMLNVDELMNDLQNVQTKNPDACVQVNTGTPTVVFI